MEREDLDTKLLLGLFNPIDVGSKRLLGAFEAYNGAKNILSYECIIYKLYCLTKYTKEDIREGTPFVMAIYISYALSNVLGKTPEFWEDKLFKDFDKFSENIFSGTAVFDTLVKNLVAITNESIVFSTEILDDGTIAVEEIDEYVKHLTEDYLNDISKLND